jgi:signal transduction histidine kinase
VKVRDNGVGIAPAYHDQIFGLFKRLQHRSVSGTGIGLALCKKIVDGMGGRIWVESEVGQGATFCFTARIAPQTEPPV